MPEIYEGAEPRYGELPVCASESLLAKVGSRCVNEVRDPRCLMDAYSTVHITPLRFAKGMKLLKPDA